ncbi:MAG: TerC/Alx family metal homeostasis membrane protein [Solirubrobacteraceae bacterium]|nr:TerC/Alx family metal homeostasis membrane protein [Solirubrobacteraceae bacterium]
MPDFLTGTTGAWIGLSAAIFILLVLDLAVLRGRGGQMTTRQAAITSVVWVAISLVFGVVLAVLGTTEQAGNYLAGYVVEKSLSLDNVFVFLVVFNAFAIPEIQRARLLTFGIVAALFLRLAFILAGAAALQEASWLSIPFALFLAWTGWKLWKDRHDSGGEEKLVENVRGKLRVADGDHGQHFTIKLDGKRYFTAAGAVLVAIAIVDIIFAVDSVPAILAITTDTFVVFAANAFALLGLRPLFFLVADLVERLYYLKAALALLLIFIAVKMGLSEFIGKVPAQYSLLGVFLILGGGVVLSLLRNRNERNDPPSGGSGGGGSTDGGDGPGTDALPPHLRSDRDHKGPRPSAEERAAAGYRAPSPN